MERGSIIRWVLIGLALFLFVQFGMPTFFGSKPSARQPVAVVDWTSPPADQRAPEALCDIHGSRFQAQISSRGASLRHYVLSDPRYLSPTTKQPLDLVTTTVESRMPLRTDLRLPEGEGQQVPYDDLDWKLAASNATSCTFTYTDGDPAANPPVPATTSLTKTFSTTGNPFELGVTLEVRNLAEQPRKHRLAIEQSSWRTSKETEGGFLHPVSEFTTEVIAKTSTTTDRQHPDAFDPDDFKDKEFTAEKWRRAPGEGRWAATSTSYFTNAAIHLEAPAAPVAETRIEEYWRTELFADKKDDPEYGHVYRSRLAYPEQELAPKASVTYKVLAFGGPKERDVLAAVGGGGHGISETINLGTFGGIGKILISYVHILYGVVGSWGWAICLLTITVKLLLFPLSLSQIKSSVAMRKLKPEMDAINAKYKDDMQQRGVATQELWRKHGVSSPVMGCIPLLLQMPVWFALYASLQTAVELYHIPFGPFIPDLSAPDKFHIIPVVLGASSFIQQKIMPPQGDAQQQKMMMYMMPGIFTVMMLVLPAGLGVYMLTNTWLGILQQVLVERYLKSRTQGPGGIEVKDKTPGGDKSSGGDKSASRALGGADPVIAQDGSAPALGKGSARVRG